MPGPRGSIREFTLEELSRFDGSEGIAAYVGYAGRVYDVTGSFLWRRGRHWALHTAGKDLTASLGKAPHGEDLLERVPLVGLLVGE